MRRTCDGLEYFRFTNFNRYVRVAQKEWGDSVIMRMICVMTNGMVCVVHLAPRFDPWDASRLRHLFKKRVLVMFKEQHEVREALAMYSFVPTLKPLTLMIHNTLP